MSLSHSVQTKNTPNHDVFDRINHFLNNTRNVQKNYTSFEQAEKAIKELVGELEKSMVQETLSQTEGVESNIHYSFLNQEVQGKLILHSSDSL